MLTSLLFTIVFIFIWLYLKDTINNFKSGDPKDLPILITQEWWDYLNPERWKNKNIEIKQGERGGLYTEDITKEGRPYRRYF